MVAAGQYTGGPALEADQLAEYVIVDGLFDFIEEAIDGSAAALNITYDPSGYPAEAWIDYEVRLSDEERGFQIRTLSPV
jgi:hypothetical protein